MRCFSFPAVALPVLFILGCARGPTLVKVSGRVTLDSRPLANAHIIFRSADDAGKPDPNKESAGQTDAEGRYTLTHPGSKREGAIPGPYRIEIHRIERSTTGGNPGIHELIPAQYNKNSKLTLTVPPEGTQEANFDLKSK